MDYLKKGRRLSNFLLVPFIWVPLMFFLILDLFVEMYHRIGFRLMGIEIVDRAKYVKMDRYKLGYLNLFQKVNCSYCGYVNGILNYWSAIVGKTEKYWCGIMHETSDGFISPRHHISDSFVKYGDERDFNSKYREF